MPLGCISCHRISGREATAYTCLYEENCRSNHHALEAESDYQWAVPIGPMKIDAAASVMVSSPLSLVYLGTSTHGGRFELSKAIGQSCRRVNPVKASPPTRHRAYRERLALNRKRQIVVTQLTQADQLTGHHHHPRCTPMCGSLKDTPRTVRAERKCQLCMFEFGTSSATDAVC